MSAAAFIAARDFLIESRTDYERAYREFRWPELDRFNWALDYFDPMARGNNGAGAVDRQRGRRRAEAELCRDFGTLEPPCQLPARARRQAWRPGAADARQCRAAVGIDAGGDEARRGRDPGDDAVDPRRSDRPLRARPGPPRNHQRRQHRRNSPKSPAITRASRLAAPRNRRIRDGTATRTPTRLRPGSRRTVRRAPPTRCCYILPQARRRGRSWFCTAIRATRSAIWRRCTGSAWGAGDIHLNISSPGWAKHAYSCFFAPWNAGATVFILNQNRFNAPALLDALACSSRHDVLRPADGVAHADPGGYRAAQGRVARGAGAPASRATRKLSNRSAPPGG